MVMNNSKAWTIPSPSHSPMEPPSSDRREHRLNFMKSVVVTWTLGENVRDIIESLELPEYSANVSGGAGERTVRELGPFKQLIIFSEGAISCVIFI